MSRKKQKSEIKNMRAFSMDLARRVGVNSATMLHHIDRLLPTNSGKMIDGSKWIYNTVDQWQEHFLCWGRSTVSNALNTLDREKMILKGYFNKKKSNRTLWYTINYDHPILKGLGYKNPYPKSNLSISKVQPMDIQESTDGYPRSNLSISKIQPNDRLKTDGSIHKKSQKKSQKESSLLSSSEREIDDDDQSSFDASADEMSEKTNSSYPKSNRWISRIQPNDREKNFSDRKEKIFALIESRGSTFARQAHNFADEIIEGKKPKFPLPYKIKIFESILEGDRPDFKPLTQEEIDQAEVERKQAMAKAETEAKAKTKKEALRKEHEHIKNERQKKLKKLYAEILEDNGDLKECMYKIGLLNPHSEELDLESFEDYILDCIKSGKIKNETTLKKDLINIIYSDPLG